MALLLAGLRIAVGMRAEQSGDRCIIEHQPELHCCVYMSDDTLVYKTGAAREELKRWLRSAALIYNTFQPEVYDIVDFKRRFGDHITFCGGISTQCILPFKTPEEVKAGMHRVMDILSVNGGYILAPTHAMPNDIPPEIVLAFMDVARNENLH